MTHLPPPLHCHDKECALVDSPFASLFSPTQMVLRFRNIQPREDTQATPEFTSTPTPNPPQTSSNPTFAHSSAYANWKATRAQFDATLPPGDSRRPVNLTTLRLAATAIRHSAVDLFILLWGVHPFRMSILLLLNFIRGALPAIRSYSQALLLDEVQVAIACHSIGERLIWLLVLEILRMLFEQMFDHFAAQNENTVQQDVRFRVEYLQMETRLRLDIPSLSDPDVQDLLQEADAFARSFNGMGGLGLLSPFDLIRTLTTIFSELLSQSYVLWRLVLASTDGSNLTLSSTQIITIASAILPTILSILNSVWSRFYRTHIEDSWTQSLYTPEEAAASEKHERMRRLAYDESIKSEIMLFGLADWILQTWSDTRAIITKIRETPKRNVQLVAGFVDSSSRELFSTLNAIPLILQLSAASLGSVTLYRSTIQTITSSISLLFQTFQMTFQGIFLMAAFHAALTLTPSMEPQKGHAVPYETMVGDNGRRGMKIEARNLTFTYPGQSEPSIKNLNMTIQPGETVAVVGHNGGGKTTLMHLLLRLYQHDGEKPGSEKSGRLLINDVDAHRYSAADLHAHSSGVFQGFSRLTNASVRENTGIGEYSHIDDDERVRAALQDAGALQQVDDVMPFGLETKLDAGGFRSLSNTPMTDPKHRRRRHHEGGDERGRLAAHPNEKFALSGGQWQRIAISRALMRPDADLMILDEASSQLDAHAQNDIFNKIAKSPNKKTLIYITHRLSTVRWADKIAFFDKGTITEFGTHDELMTLDGSYASLYNAFMTTDP